uniref:Venom S1 protease 7 n=1 Tax=Ectomocoris sp. TaxID=3104572 RepID=A0AB38ZE68_9HEMI
MKVLIITAVTLIVWRLAGAEDEDSNEFGLGNGKKTSCSCGRRNHAKGRIVGGNEAGVNEFPWMVGVKEESDIGPGCGGVILTKRIVMTASHCTEPMSNSKIQVLVGAHNIFDKKKSKFTQVIGVKQYVQHPKYDMTGNLDYDVAMLLLEEDIVFSSRVQPICFPTGKTNLVRQKVKVMGWGKLGTNKGPSPVLRTTTLDVIPLQICAQVFDGIATRAGQVNQFCTFSKARDSCQGDSGGPVAWRDPETNLYTAAGIISYGGDECGAAPGVNTDVFFHREWILSTIKELDPSQKVCEKSG